MSSFDPTNANASAGPSRTPAAITSSASSHQHLEAQQQHTTGSATATSEPPRAPHLPVVDPSGTQAPTQAANDSRSEARPKIVNTVVDQDGIRQVPYAFELCQVEDLIALISSMLDRLVAHNDRIPLTPTSLTRFHSRAPPSINVKDYLLRIARYTNVESCCLLMLLPYVDKVCARMNTFTISSLTVHRFIIAGVSVGSKALSDSFCTNSRYARVGGVSITEMNLLEKEFCEAIDWRLTSTGAILAHYYTSLVSAHPQYRLMESPIFDRPMDDASVVSTTALPKKVPLPHVDSTDSPQTRGGSMSGDSNDRRRRSSQSAASRGSRLSQSASPAFVADGEGDVEMDDETPGSNTFEYSPNDGNARGRLYGTATNGSHHSSSMSSSSIPSSSPSSLSNPGRSPTAIISSSSSPGPPLSRHQYMSPVVSSAQQQPQHYQASLSSPRGTAAPHLRPPFERTSSPALIPPPQGTRGQATASNLPSPVRGLSTNAVPGVDGVDVATTPGSSGPSAEIVTRQLQEVAREQRQR
ncbi:Pho80p cyclin [Microbotryomycetes sp. JL221]|nr:Pho80p cyclin [Microbotryomycetes sp. JL221]